VQPRTSDNSVVHMCPLEKAGYGSGAVLHSRTGET